jgi:hypothetical protein
MQELSLDTVWKIAVTAASLVAIAFVFSKVVADLIRLTWKALIVTLIVLGLAHVNHLNNEFQVVTRAKWDATVAVGRAFFIVAPAVPSPPPSSSSSPPDWQWLRWQ